ncbi:MAG: hypothetical protein K8I00_07610 [Candidatus Omnitrophica bacterium]|nr:hypothetical protein [Candidatus Omnitrophota bacterium]
MSKSIRLMVMLTCCLALVMPAEAAEKKNTTGFGTVNKFDPKGQRVQVTAYNWDTNEIENMNYLYNVRRIEIFNMEAITELKVGDEIEFEWMTHGNKKYIVKLSKGSLPMEEVELLWDVENIELDEEAAEAFAKLQAETAGEIPVTETPPGSDQADGTETNVVPEEQDVMNMPADEGPDAAPETPAVEDQVDMPQNMEPTPDQPEAMNLPEVEDQEATGVMDDEQDVAPDEK